jgi:hypothetical protein
VDGTILGKFILRFIYYCDFSWLADVLYINPYKKPKKATLDEKEEEQKKEKEDKKDAEKREEEKSKIKNTN